MFEINVSDLLSRLESNPSLYADGFKESFKDSRPGGIESSLQQMLLDTYRGNGIYQSYLSLKWPNADIPENNISLAHLLILANNSLTIPVTPLQACASHQNILTVFEVFIPGLGVHPLDSSQPSGDHLTWLSKDDEGLTNFHIIVSNLRIDSTEGVRLIIPGSIYAVGKLTNGGYEFVNFFVSDEITKDYILGNLNIDLSIPSDKEQTTSYYESLQNQLAPTFLTIRKRYINRIAQLNSADEKEILTQNEQTILSKISEILNKINERYQLPEQALLSTDRDFVCSQKMKLESIRVLLNPNEKAYYKVNELLEKLINDIPNSNEQEIIYNPRLLPLLLQNYLVFMVDTILNIGECRFKYAPILYNQLQLVSRSQDAYPEWLLSKINSLISHDSMSLTPSQTLSFLQDFKPETSYPLGSFLYLSQLRHIINNLPTLGAFKQRFSKEIEEAFDHMHANRFTNFSDTGWFLPLINLHESILPLISMSNNNPLTILLKAEQFLKLPDELTNILFNSFINHSLNDYIQQLDFLINLHNSLEKKQDQFQDCFNQLLNNKKISTALHDAILANKNNYLIAVLATQENSDALLKQYQENLRSRIQEFEEKNNDLIKPDLLSAQNFSQELQRLRSSDSLSFFSSDSTIHKQDLAIKLIEIESGLRTLGESYKAYESDLIDEEKKCRDFLKTWNPNANKTIDQILNNFLLNAEKLINRWRFKWLQQIPEYKLMSNEIEFNKFLNESSNKEHFVLYQKELTYKHWCDGTISGELIGKLRTFYSEHHDNYGNLIGIFNQFDYAIESGFSKLNELIKYVKENRISQENPDDINKLIDSLIPFYQYFKLFFTPESSVLFSALNDLSKRLPPQLVVELIETPLFFHPENFTDLETAKGRRQVFIDYFCQIKMLTNYLKMVNDEGLPLSEAFEEALNSLSLKHPSERLINVILASKHIYFAAAIQYRCVEETSDDIQITECLNRYNHILDSIKETVAEYASWLNKHKDSIDSQYELNRFNSELDRFNHQLNNYSVAPTEDVLSEKLKEIQAEFNQFTVNFCSHVLTTTEQIIHKQFSELLPRCVSQKVLEEAKILSSKKDTSFSALEKKEWVNQVFEFNKRNESLFDQDLSLYLKNNRLLSNQLSQLYQWYVNTTNHEPKLSTYMALVSLVKICRTPRTDMAIHLAEAIKSRKDFTSYLLEITLNEYPHLRTESDEILKIHVNVQYFKQQLLNSHFSYDRLLGFSPEELRAASDDLDQNFISTTEQLITDKVEYLVKKTNNHDHYSRVAFRQFYANRLFEILEQQTKFQIGPCYNQEVIKHIHDINTNSYVSELIFCSLGLSMAFGLFAFSVIALTATLAATLPVSLPMTLMVGTLVMSTDVLLLSITSLGSLVGAALTGWMVSKELEIIRNYERIEGDEVKLIEVPNQIIKEKLQFFNMVHTRVSPASLSSSSFSDSEHSALAISSEDDEQQDDSQIPSSLFVTMI